MSFFPFPWTPAISSHKFLRRKIHDFLKMTDSMKQ